ncbi:MAG: Fic family protein [Pseudomonadota bacterium]
MAPRLQPSLIKREQEPRSRNEQEFAGYNDALGLIHTHHKDLHVSLNDIRVIHRKLYGYLPDEGGTFKQGDNHIIERHPDGFERIRFETVKPYLVEGMMQAWIKNYQTAKEKGAIDPFILTALVVFDFLCIHPFPDGNGRIARLLALLCLYHHGSKVGRWISLEKIIIDTKNQYYETLEASSDGWHEGTHDVMPWLDYFLGVIVHAYKKFEMRVDQRQNTRGDKARAVRRAVDNSHSSFSISEIENLCPAISRDTVRSVLHKMKAEGKIQATGRGPGARWRKIAQI